MRSKEADELDRERAAGKIRGPLHGIPIALKDNIQTTDMPTTGGALAFADLVPPYEATLTKNLRDAGAIIIAKTQLTELANWVAGNPPMPNELQRAERLRLQSVRSAPRSARGDRRRPSARCTPAARAPAPARPRISGPRTSARETSGSILSPSNQNMLAAIKPTVGRISRYGVIPITADQDTPGPMAKFVTDAAILFGVLEGNNPDPNDPATTRCTPPPNHDYTQFLKKDGLKGARIGIPRAGFYDKITLPGADNAARRPESRADEGDGRRDRGAQGAGRGHRRSRRHPERRRQGRRTNNFFLWGVCTDMDDVKEKKCSIDLAYGMERDFNKWLDVPRQGRAGEVADRAARVEHAKHEKMGAIKYGQSLLDISDAMDLELFRARYESDRASDIQLAATHGIDEVMKAQQPRRAALPRPRRRRDRRASRLSDRDRAVRAWSRTRRRRRSRRASTPSRSRSASASPAWRAADNGRAGDVPRYSPATAVPNARRVL